MSEPEPEPEPEPKPEERYLPPPKEVVMATPSDVPVVMATPRDDDDRGPASTGGSSSTTATDGSLDDGGGRPRLPRTPSHPRRREGDEPLEWACVGALVVPAAGAWWHASSSWRTTLLPLLEEMAEKAEGFGEAHPIQRDGGLEAFKQSRDEWLNALESMRDGNRAEIQAALDEGAATHPGWIAANVVCTGALLYVLLFLPDAAIFLQKETAQRRLRVFLNCVKYMRRCFLLLALGQAYTVHRVLGTASHIAATLKSQVKWLHQEQARLRADGLDQDEWRLNAADLDTMRWGVKLLGYNVDREFWSDFKLNGGLLLLALISVFVVIWGYIQDERERQSKPRRTVFEKMAGSERKAVERAQVSAATVGLRRGMWLLPRTL